VERGHALLSKPFTMEELQIKVEELLSPAVHSSARG
jgi:hypothetical protein